MVVSRPIKVSPDISKNVRLVCDTSTKYNAQNKAHITVSPRHQRRYAIPVTERDLPMANRIHLVIDNVTKSMQNNMVELKLNVVFFMLRKSYIT